MSVYCPQCGAPVAEGSGTCAYCGATVSQPVQQPVYSAPQQPYPQQPYYGVPQQPQHPQPQPMTIPGMGGGPG